MQKPETANSCYLYLSSGDLDMIVSAISAYSHNVDYRDLLARLERQAKINKSKSPTRRSA